MATITSALPSVAALRCAKPLFRLVRTEDERFHVQCRDCGWLTVYSDDSAERAFRELRTMRRLAAGYIVCDRCGTVLPSPRLRNGLVRCDVCDSIGGREYEVAVFVLVVIAVILFFSAMAWAGGLGGGAL